MEKRIFWDREDEMRFLDGLYAKKGYNLVILYGRRRVGKSSLIERFCKDKEHVYYLCDKRGTAINAMEFSRIAAEAFHDIQPMTDNFLSSFEYVTKRADPGKEFIIAIDEFPYLVEKDQSIPSVFQKIADTILKGRNVMLILCGSSINMMYENALSYKSPLYGRKTGAWEVKPLSFASLRACFPSLDIQKTIEFYSVFGSMPAYLSKINPSKTLEENIKDQIMRKGTPLYMEPEILLQEELRDPSQYKNILSNMPLSTKLSEIASKSGIEAKDMPKYFSTLMNIQVVKKETPITLKKTKIVEYGIIDNLFRFWFAFCARNVSFLEENRHDFVFENYVKPNLAYLKAKAFEDVCREVVAKSEVFWTGAVGKWWGKNPDKKKGMNEEEIDIVAINDRKRILFGECKWTSEKTDVNVYEELRRKAGIVEWNSRSRMEEFALFSKSGFTDRMKSIAEEEHVHLFGLDTIEKALSQEKGDVGLG